MTRTVAVIGSDGPIGAAVANSLEKDSSIKIIKIPFYDTDDLVPKIQCADGCFVASYTDFTDTEKEFYRGKVIADACKTARIPHVVYSTQLNPLSCIGVMARNLVAKAEIEDYMKKELNLPMTCIMVPCVYEDLMGDFRPEYVDGNDFRLAIPMGISSFDVVSLEDLGDVVKTIFTKGTEYLSKTVSVCGDKITIKEMAATLTRHLAPLTFKDKQVTVPQFAQQYMNAGKIWAQDYANMFDFFSRFDQRYNVQRTKDMTKNPNIQSFDSWVKANAGRLKQSFLS